MKCCFLFCFLVYVLAQNDIISIKRPTFAMSKLDKSKTKHGYTSDKAVDGNRNGDMFKKSCYHSYSSNYVKWWMVVLDTLSVITKIRIYGRTDHSQYRTEKLSFHGSYFSRTSFINDSNVFYLFNYYRGPPSPKQQMIEFNFARLTARTIVISKPYKEEAINICEVEIYGFNFVKENSMIYISHRSDVSSKMVTYLEKLIVEKQTDCAVTCRIMENCVSFTIDKDNQCFLYNHAGGDFYWRKL